MSDDKYPKYDELTEYNMGEERASHEFYQGRPYPDTGPRVPGDPGFPDYEAIDDHVRHANDHGDLKPEDFEPAVSPLEQEALRLAAMAEAPAMIFMEGETEPRKLIDPDGLCVNAMHSLNEQASSEMKAYTECPCCNADEDAEREADFKALDQMLGLDPTGVIGLDPALRELEDEILPPFQYSVNGYVVKSGGLRRSDPGGGFVTISQLASSVKIPIETWAKIVHQWHLTRFKL